MGRASTAPPAENARSTSRRARNSRSKSSSWRPPPGRAIPGGPIFNSRGEMAGVLFGEGHGRTAGSYCGRVQWFLSSVVPAQELGGDKTMIAARSAQPAPGAIQSGGRVNAQSISIQTATANPPPVRLPSLARMTDSRAFDPPDFRPAQPSSAAAAARQQAVCARPPRMASLASADTAKPRLRLRRQHRVSARARPAVRRPLAQNTRLDRYRRRHARPANQDRLGGRRHCRLHAARAELAGQRTANPDR